MHLERPQAKISLAEFVEKTVNFRLHDWQIILCKILERCAFNKGQRIAIHGPPQYGKSVIVSQRLPAYLVGNDRNHKVALACYNETRAADFGGLVRDIVNSSDFVDVYGDLGVKKDAPAGQWSTQRRKDARDAQPSFAALGLQSGFVGRGADTLIIDDPYKSRDEAFSETINEKVWRFWESTASVRLPEDANVIVMFHRYHEDDFAGRLLATGKFEYYRFPAIADENEDKSDPTERKVGELLSPMRTREWLDEQRDKNPQDWLGQFQGVPRAAEGAFIFREWLKVDKGVPAISMWVRFWDLATKAGKSGDFTAGALVGVAEDHTVWIKDIVRFRAEWPDAAEIIAQVTESDAEECKGRGATYAVGVEEVAWQMPMIQDLFMKGIFKSVSLWPIKPKGDKKERASGWAARAKFDRLRMVPGAWNQEFISEAVAFDGTGMTHDDQIDAVSGAYGLIWSLKGDLINEAKPIPNFHPDYYKELAKHQLKEDSDCGGWSEGIEYENGDE